MVGVAIDQWVRMHWAMSYLYEGKLRLTISRILRIY